MTKDEMLDLASRLLKVRETVVSVAKSQRAEMTDLAVVALQDVALELGDEIFNLRDKAYSQ